MAHFIAQITATLSINSDKIKLGGSSTQTIGCESQSLAKQWATRLASLGQWTKQTFVKEIN